MDGEADFFPWKTSEGGVIMGVEVFVPGHLGAVLGDPERGGDITDAESCRE